MADKRRSNTNAARAAIAAGNPTEADSGRPVFFSITAVLVAKDISDVDYLNMQTFMMDNAVEGVIGVERGEKEGNLHLQAWALILVYTVDQVAANAIKSQIKYYLNITDNSWKVQAKPFTPTQTRSFMTG